MNFFQYISAKKSVCRELTDNALRDKLGSVEGKVVEIGASPNTPYRDWSNATTYLLSNYDPNYKTQDSKVYDLELDVRNIAIDNGEFDGIICVSVLEHVDKVEQAVPEMLRILRPGGQIIIAVPWLYPFHPAPDDYQRFSAAYFNQFKNNTHVQTLTIGNKFLVLANFYQLWFLRGEQPRRNPQALIRFMLALILSPVFYMIYLIGIAKSYDNNAMMTLVCLRKHS